MYKLIVHTHTHVLKDGFIQRSGSTKTRYTMLDRLPHLIEHARARDFRVDICDRHSDRKFTSSIAIVCRGIMFNACVGECVYFVLQITFTLWPPRFTRQTHFSHITITQCRRAKSQQNNIQFGFRAYTLSNGPPSLWECCGFETGQIVGYMERACACYRRRPPVRLGINIE